jgi:EpsI family protein
LKAVVAILFLALNFYIYHYFASEERHPPRNSFAMFPDAAGDWNCLEREEMEQRTIANLGVTDYLICTFTSPRFEIPVSVYLGYHQSQVSTDGGGGAETRIHPPAHCLPGSGWNIIDSDRENISFSGLPQQPADARRTVIAKGDARQLVFYWYQERGRVIADDWMKIGYLFWDRARVQRTDGALVRFTAPIIRGNDEASSAALHDLAEAISPLLPSYIPN